VQLLPLPLAAALELAKYRVEHGGDPIDGQLEAAAMHRPLEEEGET
jgi:hypothetical protein